MSVKPPEVIYSCPFVPAEWIEAHRLTPRRVAPRVFDPSIGLVPGMCPYARSFASYAASADCAAIVVTTVCDQMRRAADVIARSCDTPLFLMNVPHTWQTEASRGLYIAELERLGRFLIGAGGMPSNGIRGYATEVHLRGLGDRAGGRASGVPIALLGGPVPRLDTACDCSALRRAQDADVSGPLSASGDDASIYDLIDRAGGCVALNGTETGERTMPAAINHARLVDDPMGTLADAYFGSIPDPFRRPNIGLYEWLGRELVKRKVRAIVLRRYVWCDNWHAEAARIREFAGLPFLEIEVAETGSDAERTLSRLQSLMETL